MKFEIRKTKSEKVNSLLEQFKPLVEKCEETPITVKYTHYALHFVKFVAWKYGLDNINNMSTKHLEGFVTELRKENMDNISKKLEGIRYYHSLLENPTNKLENRESFNKKLNIKDENNEDLTEEEIKQMKCPYCGSSVKYIDSKEIYGRSYGMMYACKRYPECDTYVAVHLGTNKPKGRLSNAELRDYKKRVHAVFDGFWKNEIADRLYCYEWLAKQLNIPVEETHVGMFDVDTCKKVVKILKENQTLNLTVPMLKIILKKYFEVAEKNKEQLDEFEKGFMPKMKELQGDADYIRLTPRQQYYTYKCYDDLLKKIKNIKKEKKKKKAA